MGSDKPPIVVWVLHKSRVADTWTHRQMVHLRIDRLHEPVLNDFAFEKLKKKIDEP